MDFRIGLARCRAIMLCGNLYVGYCACIIIETFDCQIIRVKYSKFDQPAPHLPRALGRVAYYQRYVSGGVHHICRRWFKRRG